MGSGSAPQSDDRVRYVAGLLFAGGQNEEALKLYGKSLDLARRPSTSISVLIRRHEVRWRMPARFCGPPPTNAGVISSNTTLPSSS